MNNGYQSGMGKYIFYIIYIIYTLVCRNGIISVAQRSVLEKPLLNNI